MYSVYHQVNPVGVIFSLVLSYYQFTQLATFAKGNALHIALLFLSYFIRRLIIRKPTPRHARERPGEPVLILPPRLSLGSLRSSSRSVAAKVSFTYFLSTRPRCALR